MLISPSASDVAPIVGVRHVGNEHSHPARFAICSFVKQIAANLPISPATVSRILRRLGLNRMRDLEPAEPVRRYEREHPGDMIHIDIKKLGRFDKVGHRITGDRTGQSNGRGAGSSSTSE